MFTKIKEKFRKRKKSKFLKKEISVLLSVNMLLSTIIPSFTYAAQSKISYEKERDIFINELMEDYDKGNIDRYELDEIFRENGIFNTPFSSDEFEYDEEEIDSLIERFKSHENEDYKELLMKLSEEEENFVISHSEMSDEKLDKKSDENKSELMVGGGTRGY